MLGVVLSMPAQAHAIEAQVLLCYGATYSVAGAQRTHRGADVAASTGSAAASFADGEVSFSGRVPSDEGGSVFAVTVRTSDGTLVTVHPLAECWASEGEPVSIGDGLGLVAESGDSSVHEPHLHLSVRRGGTYVDPSFLLSSSTPSPADPVVAQVEPSTDSLVGSAPKAEEGAVSPEPLASASVVQVTQEPVLSASPPVAEMHPVLPVTPGHPAPAGVSVANASDQVAVSASRRSKAGGITAPLDGVAAANGLLAVSSIGVAALLATLVRRRILAVAEVD